MNTFRKSSSWRTTFAAGSFAFIVFGLSGPGLGAEEAAVQAHVQYVPQRMDDIAWENDRIGFRVYGPELEKKAPAGSGIDVWVKSVRKPVVESWYKQGDYHKDHGEGMDNYSVGKSRGCGGLGIWDGKNLHVSGHWASYEIKENDGPRAVFEVTYAPWPLAAGQTLSERRSFVLETGTNLNRLESVFSGTVSEFVVGIGIAKRAGGELYQDKERGILAYWQPEDPGNGVTGCAVLVNPKDVVGFASDDLNHLILVKAKTSASLKYRSGACWSKGLDFKTFEAWKSYLIQQASL